MPYPKGKPQSEASKQLRREKMLARIAADPERWHKLASKAGQASTTPEVCKQRTATMRERGNLHNGVAAMNASMSRPDVRAKLSAERKARFSTPEGRLKILAFAAAAQTPEVNERRRTASRAYANTPKGRGHKVKGGDAAMRSMRGASGGKTHRYGGHRFRSSWELRFAKWLDSLGVRWVYEPDAFELADGHHYTPDFLVRVPGRALPLWVEVKSLRRKAGGDAKYLVWRVEWEMANDSILLAEEVFAALP